MARVPRSVTEFLTGVVTQSIVTAFMVFGVTLFLGARFNLPLYPLLAAFGGLGGGYGFYSLSLANLSSTAKSRQREIEARLPHALAFMLALSKGGVGIIRIFKELSQHEDDYGEICKEANAVVRNVELFGESPVEAIMDVAETTPSEKFREFLKTLATVVETGADLSQFLATRCDKAYFEARDAQIKSFETVAIMAEISTISVGLMPFLLLVVLIPMHMMNPMPGIVFYAVTYVAIPVGALTFILILSQYSPWEARRRRKIEVEPPGREKLQLGKIGSFFGGEGRRKISSFLEEVVEEPIKVFWTSVPVAVGFMILRFGTGLLNIETFIGLQPKIETTLVFALLIALIPFIILHERREKRIDKIVSITPDYLSSLSAAVSSGLPPAKAIKTLPPERFGALAPELIKVRRDIEWGSPASEALSNMERRIKSGLLMRITSVMKIASRATTAIGDVLSVLANDVSTEVFLKRERKAQTFTYVLITYMIFMVFAMTAVGMVAVFIPALPSQNVEMPAGVGIGIAPIDPEMIRRIFFHAVLIQAFFLGILAGQFRTGRIRDGLKHSVIMCFVGWLLFVGIDVLPLSSFISLPQPQVT